MLTTWTETATQTKTANKKKQKDGLQEDRAGGVERRRILPDGGTRGRARVAAASGAGAARARSAAAAARCSHLEKLAAAGEDSLGFSAETAARSERRE